MCGDVLQTVVATEAAAELETQSARRQIKIIVHHQYFGGLDAIEMA